jgi:hypothetical protein
VGGPCSSAPSRVLPCSEDGAVPAPGRVSEAGGIEASEPARFTRKKEDYKALDFVG